MPQGAPDRLRARLTAVDCWVNSGRDMGEAIKLFDIRWNEPRRKADLQIIKAPDHFVPYQVNKLYTDFTLLDLACRGQLAKQTQVRLGCTARCLKHKTEMAAELCSAHSSMQIQPPHQRSLGTVNILDLQHRESYSQHTSYLPAQPFVCAAGTYSSATSRSNAQMPTKATVQ